MCPAAASAYKLLRPTANFGAAAFTGAPTAAALPRHLSVSEAEAAQGMYDVSCRLRCNRPTKQSLS